MPKHDRTFAHRPHYLQSEKRLLRAVGRPCLYCAEPMTRHGNRRASREHVVPVSRGGHFGPDGLPILFVCQSCNSDKGDLWVEEWLVELRRSDDDRVDRVALFVRDNPLLILKGRAMLQGSPNSLRREQERAWRDVGGSASAVAGVVRDALPD